MKHGDKKTVAKARKELERNRHLARALGLVIVVAVAFVAGFFVRGESAFLAGLGFPVTAEEAGPASSGSPSKSTFNSVSARVSEVEDVLAANSMDHYDLDAATAQTLEAFTASTEDGYLSYYDPARYRALRQGEFGRLVFRHRRPLLRIQRAGVRVRRVRRIGGRGAGRPARGLRGGHRR